MKLPKYLLVLLAGGVFLLLLYTRFINLNWGLPYPFHPDERNMAVALMQLQCSNVQWLRDCFNPHFFAYGQFPLYVGAILIQFWHMLTHNTLPVVFEEATMSLRFISAFASVLTVFFMLKSVQLLKKKIAPLDVFLISLMFIFSPVLIQFAHFGTTESLLMACVMMLTYLSLLLFHNHINGLKYALLSASIVGLAVATKVSALPYLLIPVLVLMWQGISIKKTGIKLLANIILVVGVAALTTIILSPHNLISFTDFISTIFYESRVGTGEIPVFYTRSFEYTVPILFQFMSIFPYALGLPITLFFLASFIFLPWNKEYVFLRGVFLLLFIPNAVVFAKWTRFVAPVFPLMLLMTVLFLLSFSEKIKTVWLSKFTYKQTVATAFLIIMTGVCILPGIAFLSVYRQPDVRFSASEWMYKHISENSFILSEGGNVVDLPIASNNAQFSIRSFQTHSFDFYTVDQDEILISQLPQVVSQADYIIVPSRRVFANHTCETPNFFIPAIFQTNMNKQCTKLKKTYPIINKYYQQLFSGELGFEQVAEFSSYPTISFFGKPVFTIPDESAEETWSVFDHPVIRIYKRI